MRDRLGGAVMGLIFMLHSCELVEAYREPAKNVKHVKKALAHLDASLDFDEARSDPNVRLPRALVLQALRRRSEANREARLILTFPSIQKRHRTALRKAGLPAVEVRVVSNAPSPLEPNVVDGVAVNEGDESISNVRVGVECKNSAGTIVATGRAYVEPTTLGPKESGSFRVVLGGPLKTEATCRSRILE